MIDTYDADKDGRLALGELSKDAGILLRKEVPKETPGNFTAADASSCGWLTRARMTS